MKVLGRIFGFLAPVAVISFLGCFVYYSLFIYKPTGHLYCGTSSVARQTDVAVHVVRQWAGKEGPTLLACPSS
jgi:hypothetical protein